MTYFLNHADSYITSHPKQNHAATKCPLKFDSQPSNIDISPSDATLRSLHTHA